MSFNMNSMEELKIALQAKKSAIEGGITLLEEQKKARALRVEEILKDELNKTLQAIFESDNKVVDGLKLDGFETIDSLNTLLLEVENLELDAVNNPVKDLDQSIAELHNKMAGLKLEQASNRLEINMAVQPNLLKAAFEEIPNAFMLHSECLNSKQFVLEIPEQLPLNDSSDDEHDMFNIHIHKMNQSTTFTQTILQNLMINISCQVPGKEKVEMEVGSVASRMMKMKAEISEESDSISVHLKRPNNIIGSINVKMLGSHIVNSPVVHHFFHSEEKEPTHHNLTIANESVNIFEMTLTGLERFEQLKLQKARSQLLLGASKFESDAISPDSTIPLDVGTSCAESIWEAISDESEDDCLYGPGQVSVFPSFAMNGSNGK
jgi:hypothetical protein